jgi:hypothetical protein
MLKAVWRIRYVYPGSRIRLSSIPDPNCLHPGSSSKNLNFSTPKKAKKWFLSSKKYDPGCSSRIPDPDADFLPSRIQGSKRHPIPDPGSGSATLVKGQFTILTWLFHRCRSCRETPTNRKIHQRKCCYSALHTA